MYIKKKSLKSDIENHLVSYATYLSSIIGDSMRIRIGNKI